MNGTKPTVIVSYSHEDSEELAELKRFLSPLERENLIDFWDDTEIAKGSEWAKEIDAKLATASVALLLITQGFVASTFICQKEVPRIIARYRAGSLAVLPVFLEPSTVKTTQYAYQDPRTGEEAVYCLDRIQGFGSPEDGETLTDLDRNSRARIYISLVDRLLEIVRVRPAAPQVAAPGSGLSSNQVFQQNFGQLDPAKRGRALQHFESIKALFALESRYLMGDEEATLDVAIEEHFAAYFQGSEHFLKLQTYSLPAGARQVRAVAVSDEAAPEFLAENSTWVVVERKGEFRRLDPLQDAAGIFWSLEPVFEGARLFVISAYSNANPIAANGIMDIWIELEELAGLCSHLTVAYGGLASSMSLKNVYYFPARRNLRFYPIDASALKSVGTPREATLGKFAAVVGYLQRTNALNSDKGRLAGALWRELNETPRQQWAGVQIPDVRADLLLIVTGTI